MKRILGLDLGTNSIGWALVTIDDTDKLQGIEGIGSRIIPMSQDILGKFDSGNSISQTAERTGYRGTRRLRERHLLRRERLHRVLHIMGFLPKHYEQYIDFENRIGQFLTDTEPKLVWQELENNTFDFLFKTSFNEMVEEFKQYQPALFENKLTIPYDWTIYYLRKKALKEKIEKEELAWLLLNFNQKRGYYQLRGIDEEFTEDNATQVLSLKVLEVIKGDKDKKYNKYWYTIKLENDFTYQAAFYGDISQWENSVRDFVITTEKLKDGSSKYRISSLPTSDEIAKLDKKSQNKLYGKIKIKTENEIEKSKKTVGTYIYDTLLLNPKQKINGKLVRTIERHFYKAELKAILDKQREFHSELQDNNLLNSCIEELYSNNESHREGLYRADFTKLFVDDIIFYQRPLKSKKSLISNCKFEYRSFKDAEGIEHKQPIKCTPKSHPLYQELRLWKFVKDLKIYERESVVDGKTKTDVDVTAEFLPSETAKVELFDWLNDRKEIKQDSLLTSYFKIKKKKGEDKLSHRWNYVEDKEYPCNETRSQMLSRLSKLKEVPENFLSSTKELELWHILYSVTDKQELEKALNSFVTKNGLPAEFTETFRKFPPFKSEYGAYSEKALKKLLPLIRLGKYWNEDSIHPKVMVRIEKLISGEVDESIRQRVREKAIHLSNVADFKGLPEWLAAYVVYNRHAESDEAVKWKTYHDLEQYLEDFKQHSLRNPIVEQVITETLRVVRDIWKKYGDIYEIHVELGREMKNPADKRAQMTRKVSENENTNLRIKALIAELANDTDIENVRPYSPSQQEILKIYEDGVINSGIEVPDDISKIAKLSQPSKSELIRYKLWLEQKYRSPYTGEVIPLAKLFTSAYQIEHIIPQSRFFDDSFTNKVICESEVNGLKDKCLGYEFISKFHGHKVELNFGRTVEILSVEAYETFVKDHYAGNQSKKKKLLMEDIPESFIERQMNDTRYITKVVKGLLSNIVREEGEEDATSKRVIPTNGTITDTLKRDWGLHDVWNRIITPRFERMNELTKSSLFGQWENKDGKQVFQTQMPLELQKGFKKKRIDHRHHAMDALVIACASRDHVNLLNNQSANSENSRYDLQFKLRNKVKWIDKTGNDRYKFTEFYKPWESFTVDAQQALENIVVSFKQNLRVINKSVNYYQRIVDGEKVIEKQTKGDNWAIRKPLHKDTVAGHVNLRFKKQVTLSAAIDQWENLVDKSLKTKIKQLINEGLDKKKIQKFFQSTENKWHGKDISKPEIYYFSDEKEVLVASRTTLNESFTSKAIESITDTGIQKILTAHLARYNEEKDGKVIEHPELAFSAEGIEDMNKNICELNGGKQHQPITKVRTYEPKGNKFNVGEKGNKKNKYVEAAKGTNLFFAIYVDENGNRNYETIPLNIIVERLKQGLSEVPEQNPKGDKLLEFLSPNDLVYVPTEEEKINRTRIDLSRLSSEQSQRIYKMVSSSGNECHFIQHQVSSLIKTYDAKSKFGEFGSLNKMEVSIDGTRVKECCIKLKVDRLGNISL